MNGQSPSPSAILSRAGIAYVSFPIFRLYLRYANRSYRTLVQNCINRLLPDPLIRTTAPSTARITILEQASLERRICHVLHYIPVRRTKGGDGDGDIDIIEDVIPLHDLTIELRSAKSPRRVFLAPQAKPLAFSYENGYGKISGASGFPMGQNTEIL